MGVDTSVFGVAMTIQVFAAIKHTAGDYAKRSISQVNTVLLTLLVLQFSFCRENVHYRSCTVTF